MLRYDVRSWACACLVLGLSTAGCSNQAGVPASPADTRAADEAAIRAATGALEQVVAAKDLDTAVSLYDEAASLFVPKAPAAIGKAAIRLAWQGLLAVPGVKLTSHITALDIARSGDLAVERGTFEVLATDPQGKPSTETGQLVLVWKKQADGRWRILADTNADDR